MNSNTNNEEEVETNQKAYCLKKFLEDCRKHPDKIMIDGAARQSAKNSPLQLNGKEEILNFISQHKEQDFNYVNTKEYRKGLNGNKPPVDSYKISLNYWDLYIAFCIIKTTNGWFIKSFHPDRSGETMSLGEMMFAKLLEDKK